MVNFINKLTNALDSVLKIIIIFFSAGMVISIFSQIISRYFLDLPLSWSEELARYLFIWITFLGAAVGVGKKGHIVIDFFTNLIPSRYKTAHDLLMSIFTGLFIVIIGYSSYKLMPIVAKSITPALQISYTWVYASLPVGSLLMIIYLINNVLQDITKLQEEKKC